MPQSYTVKIFSNTGYNRGNIPGNVNALPVQSLTFPATFEWQDRYLAQIRLSATWEQIKDADYLQLGETDPSYFLIDNKQMTGGGKTAILDLTYDPFLSAGGTAAIQIIGGWATRAHPMTDDLFDNTTPEPWSPQEPLIFRGIEYINEPDGEIATYNLVVCTCDLSRVDQLEAWVAKAVEGDINVTGPIIPAMQSPGSQVEIQDIGNTVVGSYILPGMYIYDMGENEQTSQTIMQQINVLRSLGIESAIVNSYVIPQEAIYYKFEDGNRHIHQLRGVAIPTNVDLPFVYGTYEPKNKKVYALYSSYSLQSESSGASIDFNAYDLYNGRQYLELVLFSDPAPNGSMLCRPKYYKQQATKYNQQAIRGTDWNNAGIIYQGVSGGLISRVRAGRDINNTLAQNRIQNARYMVDQVYDTYGLYSGNLKAVTGEIIKKATGGPVGAAIGSINAGMQISDNIAGYAHATANRGLDAISSNLQASKSIGDNLFSSGLTSIEAPTLAFPIDVNTSCYRGNVFICAHTGLTDNDMERFDHFLTMYGYACNKKLEQSDLYNRQYFNYLKCSDAQVESSLVSETENEMIGEILNRGIRIWHVPPTKAAYDDNPVREVT